MKQKLAIRMTLALTLSVVVLWFCQKNASALLLVSNGQPKATIVVSQSASEQVQKAAQTLQQYIQKRSGAKLPIAATATGNTITIGKATKVDTTGIDENGFILQGISDHDYVISGGSD